MPPINIEMEYWLNKVIFKGLTYEWKDDWGEADVYRIEFDDTEYDRPFYRRFVASRSEGRRAEVVEHWYLM